MNPIEFVSAGAGSGKTYRLTTILASALADKTARPSGVAAMTFTIKSAEELRQRARKVLLDAGQLDLSTSIGQSRIGTVNAVCSQLLQRYCFELGLSPEQTVLAQAQSEQMLRHALDDVLDADARERLIWYGDRFSFEREDWHRPVQFIVDAARANGIGATALRAMGAENAEAMLSIWPERSGDGDGLTRTLVEALSVAHVGMVAHIDGLTALGKEPPQVTTKGYDELHGCQRRFEEQTWAWRDWALLAKVEAGAKVRNILQPVQLAAAAHEHHPAFHRDVRKYLDFVFDLASTVLASYEKAKVVAGAQDFIDQEMLLLKALHENESVRTSLAETLDLVLVDEFQDTSPIQLAVFVELAKLAKRSVWVGDPKQAIYGFRGTDASLIASVLDAIPSWGGTFGEPLTTSRRSVPSLVHLVNQLFVQAFPKLEPDAIRLTPVRSEHVGQPSLFTWSFDSSGVKSVFDGLGPAIHELVASGVQVQDAVTGKWRGVEPGDIAVLCRTNADISLIASSLHRWGIPCESTRAGLLATPEASLVVACLRRMHDALDTMATALIVSLTESASPEVWLADRLAHARSGAPSSTWKAVGDQSHPLVMRLEGLRARLAGLTPAEALCLAKAVSGVWRAAAQWSSTPKEVAARVANVEALARMGVTYEDECRACKRPATVSGLLQWLTMQAKEGLDARAAATSGSVEVSTHHSAKGLEWPVVIMTGLDSAARTALWDVRSRTNGAFDAQDPLGGRFVHYWPRPYGSRRIPDVLRRAQQSPLGQEMQTQALDEHVRLLYVSCTRARDMMALAVHKTASAWTTEIGGTNLLFSGRGDIELSDGTKVKRLQQVFGDPAIGAEPPTMTAVERRWYPDKDVERREPLWLRPSDASKGNYRIETVDVVGERIPLKGNVDMTSLGSALHNAIAFCLTSDAVTIEQVSAIASRWGVGTAFETQAVVKQAKSFADWARGKWPGATLCVEVPLEVRLKSGRVVRGQIDLLVGTGLDWVLIDHKADPRSTGRDDRLALEHGAQLEAYAQAVTEATGLPVLERWLFLPVAGQAVKIASLPPVAVST